MHRLSLAALALSIFFILPLNALAADPEAGRPAADAQPLEAGRPAQPAPLEGFSIPAPAQENLTGSEYLARAEESYLGGDYEKALDDFTKALPLLTDDADRARVHSRLAFVYSALDKQGEVYTEFLKSLKLDPSLTLERDLVSPQVYEAFLKARDEVIREGTLVCNCDPPGAEVYLDGVLLGEAPVRRDRIKEGEHVLILKKQGYETSVSRITIKKGVTLTIEDKMTQASGEISVGSEPPGAAIVLDGKEAGTTPATLRRVTGGRHTVTLRRDYFEPFEFNVELAVGGRKELHSELRRRLLFVGLTEGAQAGGMGPELLELAREMRSKMGGLEVTALGMDELAGKLSARGLDPASLSFMKRPGSRLELEDVAVLSGVLEQERAELALVAFLHGDGSRKGLELTLYSITGSAGDRTHIASGDGQGLKPGFDAYLWRWSQQEKSTSATIGARLVDRADGGVEVAAVLPGYPASVAGLMPGDRISAVDGVKISGADGFMARLKAGMEQQLSIARRTRCSTVKVTPVNAPVETPPDSGVYLYNLALVDYTGGPGSAPLAMLNLGNVYAHMGDYEKAVNAYKAVSGDNKSGVCAGTALFRLGQAYEKLMLWVEAAGAYRKAMLMYPDATLERAEGPSVAVLAKGRLMELFALGLVDERWWL